MHGSLTNLTKKLRFSCDVRFQPGSHPVDPRYTASSSENPALWSPAKRPGSGLKYNLGFVSESVRRSMAEAKEEWSLVREPVGDFGLSPAAQRATDAVMLRNTSSKL